MWGSSPQGGLTVVVGGEPSVPGSGAGLKADQSCQGISGVSGRGIGPQKWSKVTQAFWAKAFCGTRLR